MDIFKNLVGVCDRTLKELDKYIFTNPGQTFKECSDGFREKYNFQANSLEFLINQINQNPNTYYDVIGPFKIKDKRIYKKINLTNKNERSQLYSLISENSDLKKIIEKQNKELEMLRVMATGNSM